MSWRNSAELQSEAIVPYMDRTSVARRIQLGAVRILQTKIAEGSDGIMAKPQYMYRSRVSQDSFKHVDLSVSRIRPILVHANQAPG